MELGCRYKPEINTMSHFDIIDACNRQIKKENSRLIYKKNGHTTNRDLATA